MILTSQAIHDAVVSGSIVIDPFDPSRLGPNSYDFALGSRCRTYLSKTLDSRRHNPSRVLEVDERGLELAPNQLYLFNTAERIGSNSFVPIIRGRSSFARLGVFIHITADLIDLGSVNQLTLQLHAVLPVRVYPGTLVGQVTFWRPEGPIALYRGKYGQLESPAASLLYEDPFFASDASLNAGGFR